MKPTKRQITYLQSFGKAFARKPANETMNALCKALWSERDAVKRLGVRLGSFDVVNGGSISYKNSVDGKEYSDIGITKVEIFKPPSNGPTICMPVDCGVDMVTVNQLNRNVLMKSVQCGNTWATFKRSLYMEWLCKMVNFQSMENPEQVEC